MTTITRKEFHTIKAQVERYLHLVGITEPTEHNPVIESIQYHADVCSMVKYRNGNMDILLQDIIYHKDKGTQTYTMEVVG